IVLFAKRVENAGTRQHGVSVPRFQFQRSCERVERIFGLALGPVCVAHPSVGFRVEWIRPEYFAKAIDCFRMPVFAKRPFTFLDPALSGLLLAAAFPTS